MQGGVEKHAEQLCPLLVEQGCQVDVIVRSNYQPDDIGSEWQCVKFHGLWAPKHKGLEAIIHTFLGVLFAAIKRPDILHIHAIGPALMVPLARVLGLKVVVTHHGPDYDRQKWGGFARTMLKLGEYVGMRYANARIVISKVIGDMVLNKHHVSSILIPNGVTLPTMPQSMTALQELNLEEGKYVLLVSRLVPEKRHLDLISAFRQSGLHGWKLALVGASDHPDDYVRALQRAVASFPEIVMTGYKSGLGLRELYAHAGMFVLPSSHEGLPIAMLEALSYGLPVIASDIPANLEVGLDADHYFKLGNIDDLAAHLKDFSTQQLSAKQRSEIQKWVAERYNWAEIAAKTMQVYHSI